MRAYQPERDFLRVRDFLARTYAAFPGPVNWGIERWNYARYFVAPMLGFLGSSPGGAEGARAAIRQWEDLVSLWEVDGEIVGVTAIEHPTSWHPGFGEIFLQRHPEHLDLLDEMLAHAERSYANPETGRAYLVVYEDDEPLLQVVERRGYARNASVASSHLELLLEDIPPMTLPEGYRLFSMAEVCDIEARREIFGRAFNHTDPREWPAALAYQELQRAPDYRPEHDLVIAAPDGTYAACGIVWYDSHNQVGHLEPLGTRPEYRKRGLARELLHEGLRRLQRLGATRMPMTGGFDPFYESLGFRRLRRCFAWEKVVSLA